ncbi:MAG: DUF4330 domain-containing protein [Tissierellales bacterium]|nr:DUF4330 domain-containing protein [Tissierellales bacterium]
MANNNRKFLKKFNIIDFMIGIIIIAIVLFGLNQLGIIGPRDVVVDNVSKIEIVFFQEEVNSFTADNVKIGDPSTEPLLNTSFGEVTSIKTGPSISYGRNKYGEQTTSSKDGYSHIYITLTSNGKVSDNGIIINGNTYYIGQVINLRVGTSIFYGRIDAANQL